MIYQVYVQELKQFVDERGKVMHMMRSDNELFKHFGEIYFSTVNPGKVKAWKRHMRMTQNFAVPVGAVRFVIWDPRPDSPTSGEIEEIVIGADQYRLLTVPPHVWYGFQCVSKCPGVIANCTDMLHDPSETEKVPQDSSYIPYVWK